MYTRLVDNDIVVGRTGTERGGEVFEQGVTALDVGGVRQDPTGGVISREAWTESIVSTYSEVEARKKGEVSRKASTAATPRASSPNLLTCMVFVVKMETESDVANGRSDLVSEAVDGVRPA